MHAGHERKENEREREARARVRERDGTQNVQTAAQQQEQSRGLKASSAAHGAIVCKLANFSYGHLQAGSLVRLILCQIDSPARPPDIAVGTLFGLWFDRTKQGEKFRILGLNTCVYLQFQTISNKKEVLLKPT